MLLRTLPVNDFVYHSDSVYHSETSSEACDVVAHLWPVHESVVRCESCARWISMVEGYSCVHVRVHMETYVCMYLLYACVSVCVREFMLSQN